MEFLKRKENRKKLIIAAVVSSAAIILIVFGIGGFQKEYKSSNNPDPIIPVSAVVETITAPDETPIAQACEEYTVDDNQPRQIEIPSLAIAGCIQKVGVDQNNSMAVPSNIHLAGWFIDSPLPGEAGVSIIDGHVLGQYNDAIFTNLNKVQKDDIIKIEYGDRSWKEFKVLETGSYTTDTPDAYTELYKQVAGVTNQLTLITCDGTYDWTTQTYDKREIVKAELIQ